MKKARTSSRTRANQFLLNTALLLVSAVASYSLFGRKPKQARGNYGYNPKAPVPYLPGPDPHKSSTFFKLRLSKGQYETLKSYSGNTFVFQFFYPQESDCGSPTLFCYAMKKYHQSIKRSPEVLSYDEPTNEPLKGRAQVLGDTQIRISTLDNFIRKVVGKNDFENLIFTPRYKCKNPHISYDISVDGSNDVLTCDPSPPAEAY